MKMMDYFRDLPVGEVVNKRGLAYLKRLGYIYDYSEWGYLESLRILGKRREDEPEYCHDWLLEVSPNRACKGASERDHSQMTSDDMHELYGSMWGFELNGIRFTTKYFDGCFKPYLIKSGPDNGKSVKHSMSLWGNVI